MILGAIAMLLMVSTPRKKPSPWFGQYDPTAREAYDFQLTDQNGSPLHLRDLRGKIVLLTFGFTHCPNICPTTLGNLAAIYRRLPPAAQEHVRVVFISVDPERDTVTALKDYVPFFHESFIGLTGEPADIGNVARAYGAFYRKADAVGGDKKDYMIDHSTYTYLIDPEGKFRLLYRFDQMPDSARICEDILRVLNSPATTG